MNPYYDRFGRVTREQVDRAWRIVDNLEAQARLHPTDGGVAQRLEGARLQAVHLQERHTKDERRAGRSARYEYDRAIRDGLFADDTVPEERELPDPDRP